MVEHVSIREARRVFQLGLLSSGILEKFQALAKGCLNAF